MEKGSSIRMKKRRTDKKKDSRTGVPSKISYVLILVELDDGYAVVGGAVEAVVSVTYCLGGDPALVNAGLYEVILDSLCTLLGEVLVALC